MKLGTPTKTIAAVVAGTHLLTGCGAGLTQKGAGQLAKETAVAAKTVVREINPITTQQAAEKALASKGLKQVGSDTFVKTPALQSEEPAKGFFETMNGLAQPSYNKDGTLSAGECGTNVLKGVIEPVTVPFSSPKNLGITAFLVGAAYAIHPSVGAIVTALKVKLGFDLGRILFHSAKATQKVGVQREEQLAKACKATGATIPDLIFLNQTKIAEKNANKAAKQTKPAPKPVEPTKPTPPPTEPVVTPPPAPPVTPTPGIDPIEFL